MANVYSLMSRLFLPPTFDCLQHAKRSGKTLPHGWCQCRQRGEGSSFDSNALHICILCFEWYAFCCLLVNVWTWDRNYKNRPRLKLIPVIKDPSPPLSTKVDTGIFHMIKWTRPFLHIASNQKVDGEKAWEEVRSNALQVMKMALKLQRLGQKLLASDGVGMCENSTLYSNTHIISITCTSNARIRRLIRLVIIFKCKPEVTTLSMKAVAEHCSWSLGRRRYSSVSASRDILWHCSWFLRQQSISIWPRNMAKMATNFCHVKIPLMTVHSTV